MGQYKIIQDIEAEDKLVGPLSLRQFIYAAIVVITLFIMYRLALVNIFLALPFLPPVIFFGLLAAPFGQHQSSEVWLLAKIGFFLKPRRRIWDQSGTKNLVTITAPKRIERQLTDTLSPTEIKSRLKALSDTIDTRGWSTKNVNVNLSAQPGYNQPPADTDRLVAPGQAIPQQNTGIQTLAAEVQPSDDILDTEHNQAAQKLDQMINQAAQAHKKQIQDNMSQQGQAQHDQAGRADYWFLHGEPGQSTNKPKVIDPGSKQSDEASASDAEIDDSQTEAVLEKIHQNAKAKKAAYGHMRSIKPLAAPDGQKPKQKTKKSGKTKNPDAKQQKSPSDSKSSDSTNPKPIDPAKIRLAGNDDLNIDTIAREAGKAKPQEGKLSGGKTNEEGEVVISLH